MSEIIGCYSRGIARASFMRFEVDSGVQTLSFFLSLPLSLPFSLWKKGRGGGRALYRVDFNRGLVTIMRPGNGGRRSLPR